jgi:ATP-dependent protease ClpP protease subunit
MRDIPGLSTGLLERASMRARNDAPTFRFHGSKAPANRTRTPIVASEPSSKVLDGVATMRLYEPIDSWGGPWGISALEFLDSLDEIGDDVSEIRLHINSPGGEVWEALAILNSLRAHPARLVAIVDGIAASAASFIACAADETIMAKNTQLMIHDAAGICLGNAKDMHQFGDLLDQISDNIATIYADKSGTSLDDTRAAMLAETWYLPQEALDAGLIDSIEGDDAEEEPAASFDLKGVGAKYASRAEAPAPAARTATPPADEAGTTDRRVRLQQRRHALNQERATA